MLLANSISLTIGSRHILKGISLEIKRGETLGVMGPNGCGKSTLVKVLSRLLVPNEGEILLDGQALSSYSSKQLARKIAVVSQDGLAPLPLTVSEAVQMGRYPHQRLWKKEIARDEEVVQQVLVRTRLTELACKPLDMLSGGERQRVAIACAMAQEPEVLLLDEPTTYLDIGYQIGILDLLRRWQQETGGAALLVLHDLNLAAQYCDRLMLLKKGGVIGSGSVEEIMEADLLADVYGIRPLVVPHPNLHIPQVLLERT
ncbi:iron complex transport system ATP-binding protein [Aneurinibacillus soli]|uniref:Iron(3+)-hydroxamate import ATP-binding protein FhuC n=1 Tax=Aneurinibacillus soli TaxID=1500254 RepID=A0A0U5ASF4_9BACL|nr:ABC transporter ATP-binding protein [Aneurinibacillus soli]PYE59257.1 iron complex transport system ATP-binding protein [Aneurinibacillus soli]BAU26753.1 Iron(3+)-hydroxamate import ATP-binding protein FhuC [Aneurinibacillus soli]